MQSFTSILLCTHRIQKRFDDYTNRGEHCSEPSVMCGQIELIYWVDDEEKKPSLR